MLPLFFNPNFHHLLKKNQIFIKTQNQKILSQTTNFCHKNMHTLLFYRISSFISLFHSYFIQFWHFIILGFIFKSWIKSKNFWRFCSFQVIFKFLDLRKRRLTEIKFVIKTKWISLRSSSSRITSSCLIQFSPSLFLPWPISSSLLSLPSLSSSFHPLSRR